MGLAVAASVQSQVTYHKDVAPILQIVDPLEEPSEPNLDVVARFTGLDRPGLAALCWPQYQADGRVNLQSMSDFQVWAQQNGLLDRVLATDDFWDPRFVESVNRTLGAPSA